MIHRCGEVILIGAGPGDPELLTIKALRVLQQCDVVVHDRLVSNDMLKLCNASAQLIDVGKYPEHHRISQAEINEILVTKASEGLKVARLKGGDPFVFGRGMEELTACRERGISCSVIPGISSCIAGPGAIGVPVTMRGQARSFAVITGQTDPNLPEHEIDFSALASIDTVVFMMGRKNLNGLVASLVQAGRGIDTPVACVQQATMSGQRSVRGTLGTIANLADQHELKSPMLTVVGKVAAYADTENLAQEFQLNSMTV